MADQPSMSVVRKWAQDNGIDVPTRGRVPDAVFEQYAQVHAGTQEDNEMNDQFTDDDVDPIDDDVVEDVEPDVVNDQEDEASSNDTPIGDTLVGTMTEATASVAAKLDEPVITVSRTTLKMSHRNNTVGAGARLIQERLMRRGVSIGGARPGVMDDATFSALENFLKREGRENLMRDLAPALALLNFRVVE